MRKFYSRLEELIKKALRELYPEKEFSFFLEVSRNKKFGDLALPLPLKISSQVREEPLKVANKLKRKLESLSLEAEGGIEKIEVAPPGFVNFFLKEELVKKLFFELLNKGKDFFKEELSKKKILIEFVSANPTGPLSIAHGRGAIIGDVVGEIYSFLGADVVREYYINDEGAQIDLFVDSVLERIKELKKEPFKIPEGGYKGEYVKEIAHQLLEEGLDKKEEIERASLNWALKTIKEDLRSLDIEFDSWVSQRSLRGEGKIKEVIDFLTNKNLAYFKEKALWFRSSFFGDDKDRVLIRKDNSFTYFSADIAYHKYKIDRGFELLINLWGPDHHGYVKRLESALKLFKEKKDVDFKIIIFQLVSLKSKEKVSKRKGTIVFLRDLVRKVGKDAVRFYYLLRKNSSHLQFDIDKALKRNFENPLYYIQYAHARICSIIDKYQEGLTGEQRGIDYKKIYLLKEKEELSLMKKAISFKNILELVSEEVEPYYLIDYLKSLASEFHLFYERRRVLIEDNPQLTEARLALISGIRIVLKLGLTLLKLSAPSKM